MVQRCISMYINYGMDVLHTGEVKPAKFCTASTLVVEN